MIKRMFEELFRDPHSNEGFVEYVSPRTGILMCLMILFICFACIVGTYIPDEGLIEVMSKP